MAGLFIHYGSFPLFMLLPFAAGLPMSPYLAVFLVPFVALHHFAVRPFQVALPPFPAGDVSCPHVDAPTVPEK